MTSELIIKRDETSQPAPALAGMTLFRHLLADVRSQSPAAPTEDDIFLLPADEASSSQDNWKRNLSASLALLKQAYSIIEHAEGKISEQQERISQLQNLATSDELTGIKNRRGFYEAFTAELDRCDRGQTDGGLLILIDLDNFKAINDTYGHAAGDACLRLVARTLAGEIRLMDAAARLGGDEFVLLLSNTTKRDAAGRAQTLGQRLNNLSLAWEGDLIPVRASLGLKGYKGGDSAESIFSAADTAMYASKRSRKPQDRSASRG